MNPINFICLGAGLFAGFVAAMGISQITYSTKYMEERGQEFERINHLEELLAKVNNSHYFLDTQYTRLREIEPQMPFERIPPEMRDQIRRMVSVWCWPYGL